MTEDMRATVEPWLTQDRDGPVTQPGAAAPPVSPADREANPPRDLPVRSPLPATRRIETFTAMRAAIDSLTYHVDNTDNIATWADALHQLRQHRRAVSDLERHIELRLADAMTQDVENVDNSDDVVLERRRGTKRTKWQSEAVLAQLGIQARVDADGVVQPPDEQFTRLYEAVQDCCPLTASLSWRAGALRERGIDPDEYAATEPGRISVAVSVKENGYG